MSVKKLRTIYQLKVTLNDSKPPIWRRILVSSNINLGNFHRILQIVLGWTDSHLHQFISGGTMYSTPYDEFGNNLELECEDENKYKLSQLLKKEKGSLIYEYDFGDSWKHKIVLEKILPYDGSVKVPTCIKGKRACPPEDCGGIWGYQDFLEAIQDPSHPEHQEMLEWIGGEFDPEYFDVKETNEILADYHR
jgi:hypothetical protein